MLVLTRKKGESIMLGGQIEVVVLGTEGDNVRLGIKAPRDIEVYRKEIFDTIQQSNKEAVKNNMSLEKLGELLQRASKQEE